jgi:hypothetical protein
MNVEAEFLNVILKIESNSIFLKFIMTVYQQHKGIKISENLLIYIIYHIKREKYYVGSFRKLIEFNTNYKT